jgi:PHD/YefM family antitoxin component YafN of YafNO toxin-antitoxin module
MKEVNALKLRNNLGKILESLNKTGEPILVSKGRKIRAVLITPLQFQRRFLDLQTEERKRKLLDNITHDLRSDSIEKKDCVEILRELRGYEA